MKISFLICVYPLAQGRAHSPHRVRRPAQAAEMIIRVDDIIKPPGRILGPKDRVVAKYPTAEFLGFLATGFWNASLVESVCFSVSWAWGGVDWGRRRLHSSIQTQRLASCILKMIPIFWLRAYSAETIAHMLGQSSNMYLRTSKLVCSP